MHIPQILKENKEQKFVEINKIKQIQKKKWKQDTQQWHKNLTKRNTLKKKKASQYRLINFKPCIFHKFYKKTKKKKFDKMGIQKKKTSKQRLINVKP